MKFWAHRTYPHERHWKWFLPTLEINVAYIELSLAPKKKITKEGIMKLLCSTVLRNYMVEETIIL